MLGTICRLVSKAQAKESKEPLSLCHASLPPSVTAGGQISEGILKRQIFTVI